MSGEFTPGPWAWEDNELFADGGFLVLSTGITKIGSARVYVREEADAHLIAAAPDLYEACQAAYNMVATDQGPPNWDLLRAALKKARGEQP